MFRLLFTFLFVLSLLLGAGTCVLWARSYWRMDGLMFLTRFGWDTINTFPGKFFFYRQPQVTDNGVMLSNFEFASEPVDPKYKPESDPFMPSSGGRAGLRYGHVFTSMANDAWWVEFPIWWVAATAGLTTVLGWFVSRRLRRARRG